MRQGDSRDDSASSASREMEVTEWSYTNIIIRTWVFIPEMGWERLKERGQSILLVFPNDNHNPGS